MARLDNPNDLEMPAFRNSCPICKVENTAEIRSWPFSDRELCCTIGIRTFLFGMVSFSNFHFTKRERCFSVKNEIFQEKILALSRLNTNFQGAKVELFINSKRISESKMMKFKLLIGFVLIRASLAFSSPPLFLKNRWWFASIIVFPEKNSCALVFKSNQDKIFCCRKWLVSNNAKQRYLIISFQPYTKIIISSQRRRSQYLQNVIC